MGGDVRVDGPLTWLPGPEPLFHDHAPAVAMTTRSA
jgi:hypothetical protein